MIVAETRAACGSAPRNFLANAPKQSRKNFGNFRTLNNNFEPVSDRFEQRYRLASGKSATYLQIIDDVSINIIVQHF